MIDNAHEHISPTTALLQSAQKGRHMLILGNHFIQSCQPNNMIVNELLNYCTIYSYLLTSRMRLQIPPTPYSLPSTKATDQNGIFYLIAHTHIENTDT
jgi:hypothetical protein